MQLFTENPPTGTYATYARAVKRAEEGQKLAEDNSILSRGSHPRYLIATNESGRFFPVFIGNETFNMVHAGFHVAN